MESKEIQDLIELISRSNFSTFELERNGFRIRLVKDEPGRAAAAPAGQATTVVQPVLAAESSAGTETPPAPAVEVEEGLQELHSPIVGTFYSAPSPDSADFVEVGNRVTKGQVMCIVEAMKVMNEIECEIDAEVVEILVKNGQPVEYGEVLFRLRPS